MKIYSFNGKKKAVDLFDEDSSPLYLGQKFNAYAKEDAPAQENTGDEKQIEK